MNPIETLVHEHKIILQVLDAIESDAQKIANGDKVNGDRVRKMVDFIRGFADTCHHAKEEKHLFRAMNEQGMPLDVGPLAVMLHDHEVGRQTVRDMVYSLPMAEMGDMAQAKILAGSMNSYVQLLRSHIVKEDSILYPMALHLLSAENLEDLSKEFDRVEAEEMGEGVHEKFHQLARELVA